METEIGVLAVRRSILIKAPPERVWQEFESHERMSTWFGTGHRLLQYEARVGGAVLLEVDIDGVPKRYGGKVVAFEPGHEVTWENDWIPNEGWLEPTLITLRLTPALGGTLVELFHHAIERVGADAAEQHRGFEGGWSMRQLEALHDVVEA
ncbi:MAG: SRPBCC domain-containing protein [Dehalococcoidia bacterium]